MRSIAISLKRLYVNECITKAQLKALVRRGTIYADEYKYITGEIYVEG